MYSSTMIFHPTAVFIHDLEFFFWYGLHSYKLSRTDVLLFKSMQVQR
jgi:hypothetical protein